MTEKELTMEQLEETVSDDFICSKFNYNFNGIVFRSRGRFSVYLIITVIRN